jgi:hypothetical protein
VSSKITFCFKFSNFYNEQNAKSSASEKCKVQAREQKWVPMAIAQGFKNKGSGCGALWLLLNASATFMYLVSAAKHGNEVKLCGINRYKFMLWNGNCIHRRVCCVPGQSDEQR